MSTGSKTQPSLATAPAQALETASELSRLLDCGLDAQTLSTCVALLESGVSPEVRA